MKEGWTREWAPLAQEADRHWKRLTLLAWALVAATILWSRWGSIYWFALGDTDDNMRISQVRALLQGQSWYDLRNYRLDPPRGFDIHWSRLVDVPIAGLILGLRPFVGPAWAERWACGIAPLLPLSVAMLGVGAVVRRLIHPLAWPLACLALMCCPATLPMFMPERIDHHGWQLAFLSLTLAGLCDPERRRGGLVVGLASAASLTIGLEMLPYCAMAGGVLALRWVADRAEAARLEVYAIALSAGSAVGYAGFQGWGSSVARCDALTPVWLSVMVWAGGALFVLARASPADRALRAGLAVFAGGCIAWGFAHAFPQCLGRPEQVSPELQRDWLSNVREAKPIYLHPLRNALTVGVLPVVGVIGAAWATWRRRASRAAWALVLLFDGFAAALLLWQMRAGPAAQLLAVPGVVALVWGVGAALTTRGARAVAGALVAAALAAAGLFAAPLVARLPIGETRPHARRVERATGLCLTQPAMAALDRYPTAVVFTFIDLGPRMIAVTHHYAIAGPYHRDGAAILDVQHAFTGSPGQARAVMRAHGATLLVVCPNMAESTVYRARAPRGFYARLAHGERFAWLTQLPLPRGDPLRVWRIG